MPISPTGVITYLDVFEANGVLAGFDINQSGYGENNEINATIRPVPWANPGVYTLVIQSSGLNPRTRHYSVTVYAEQDYGALRSVVGAQGLLITRREGSPTPGQPQPAILTSVKRGNFQYPAWPEGGDGVTDLQTLELDFVMLS